MKANYTLAMAIAGSGLFLAGALLDTTTSDAVAASKAKAAPVAPAADADVESRIVKLHRDLHITTAQETQWQKVAQSMRDNAAAMAELRQQQVAAKSDGAVDELKAYASVIDAHADGVHKFIPNFESLYDSMSDAQKKTADAVFHNRIEKAAGRNS